MKQKITDWEYVKPGDKVTVRTRACKGQRAGDVVTATAYESEDGLMVLGWRLAPRILALEVEFISAEREVPDLPTEPGFYVDKDNDVWELQPDGKWSDGSGDDRGVAPGVVAACAPFTRLVPEGSVAFKPVEITDEMVARAVRAFWGDDGIVEDGIRAALKAALEGKPEASIDKVKQLQAELNKNAEEWAKEYAAARAAEKERDELKGKLTRVKALALNRVEEFGPKREDVLNIIGVVNA